MFYKTKNPAQCGIFCFRTFALPFKYIMLKNKPPFLKHPAILVLLLLVLAITPGIGWGQVYYHDFGITAITAKPYTGPPTTLDPNLSGSSWTTSAAAFAGFAGNGGGTSACLSINNSSGTPTFTLTFNVATGYQLTVTSFNFWRVRSTSGAQNWSMTINGIAVGNGNIPATGAMIGQTNVSNPVSGLTGIITLVYTMSGASASGSCRLDDFTNKRIRALQPCHPIAAPPFAPPA